MKAKAELGDANEGMVDGKDIDDNDEMAKKKSTDLAGDDFFLGSDEDEEDGEDDKKKSSRSNNSSSSSSSSSTSSSSSSSDSDSESDDDEDRKNKVDEKPSKKAEMPVTREPIYIPLPKAKQKATEERKRPANAPLRTRAEGGRKRRKKK